MQQKPPKNMIHEAKKTGPKADTVIIDGKWEDAVGKALEKKRPESGWPDGNKKRPNQ